MKISVVTVTFNSAKTIVDTLDSVAMQTHHEIEHLIIDGASQDGTLDLIRKSSDPKIRLISESDKGIYDAMNKGLKLATGEVIGFLNSDDIYVDNVVLSKIAKVFEDTSVDACYADLVYVSQDNSRVMRYWKSKPYVRGDFAKGWSPAHPTFYVRKSVVERLGLFDQTYKIAADTEFMMRYLERGLIRAVYIPQVLVRMRVGGASNQGWKNIIRQNKEVFAALRKNGIPFSRTLFWVHKLYNRFWQIIKGQLNIMQ